ncbi:MAG: hypothetical protein K0R24_2376 [Gammaproteobacteria bacterium]|jgi:hypothetical protein|nr:hypothetical protein [Gammaproteobacteria bacterium]MCE3239395.1 hypothetical protein [Gammaproteobacteria bacterium]
MRCLTVSPYFLYFIAAIISIFCSVWVSSQETLINPDGICYLQSAAAMKAGIHFAMNLCDQAKWPLYAWLIAKLVDLTQLSYVHAAYVLDSFFSLLTVLFFMRILSFLTLSSDKLSSKNHSSCILSLGALVILFAHEFNAVKAYIIRDHGFWTFYLLSILMLLYYFRERQWRYAFAWSVSSTIATLFRIEGAIFLLAIPWVAWLEMNVPVLTRIKTFLQLNTFIIIASIFIVGVFLVYHPHLSGRLSELQFQLFHGLIVLKQNFQLKSAGLAQAVLSENGARDATPVLFITLFIWYFCNVIVNLSLIYSVLLVYAWVKKLVVTTYATRLVLWSYVFLNVLITAVFLGQNMFLSKRYLLALSLTLMLWIPFTLHDFLQQWPQRKWPLIVASVFIFIASLGGLFDFGYSKQYVREAGQWLENHVPKNAKLYSNDLQLMYYSNHFGNQLFIKSTLRKYHDYDYIALRGNQKSSFFQEIKLIPIQIFQNKRGDQVRIYRKSL